jgi:hypothetical protein
LTCKRLERNLRGVNSLLLRDSSRANGRNIGNFRTDRKHNYRKRTDLVGGLCRFWVVPFQTQVQKAAEIANS